MKLPLASPVYHSISLLFQIETTLGRHKSKWFGGASIQFRMGRKNEYVHYTLVDFVKNWRVEWFYAGNM